MHADQPRYHWNVVFHVLFVHRQMRYSLGSWGSTKSYVIGYGPNQPQRPHHRQTACSALYTEPCALQNSGTCCAGESGGCAGESGGAACMCVCVCVCVSLVSCARMNDNIEPHRVFRS